MRVTQSRMLRQPALRLSPNLPGARDVWFGQCRTHHASHEMEPVYNPCRVCTPFYSGCRQTCRVHTAVEGALPGSGSRCRRVVLWACRSALLEDARGC